MYTQIKSGKGNRNSKHCTDHGISLMMSHPGDNGNNSRDSTMQTGKTIVNGGKDKKRIGNIRPDDFQSENNYLSMIPIIVL